MGDMSGAGDERFRWDALVSRVLHPVQVVVIEALLYIGLPLAPSEIARMTGGYHNLQDVGYHVRILVELGILELIDTEPIRGATKHYYVLAPESGSGVEVAVKITARQRDALYDRILNRLSGIDDVWSAASSADYDTADRLGREYSDELRLVLDDLGWGDGPGGEEIELTADSDVLRRVFSRLRDSTAGERAAQAASWTESRALDESNQLVGEACATVLEALDDAA